MVMNEEQTKTLTNLIVENRDSVLRRQKELDNLVTAYLQEKDCGEIDESDEFVTKNEPISEDKITNLINELKRTNQLIGEGIGKRIEDICKRLSRL